MPRMPKTRARDVAHHAENRPVRVGISACLLGEEVRFDGGHKRDAFLADTFSRFVEWVPICPEVEAGFGTPREPMHLLRRGAALRLVTNESGRDVTARLDGYAARRVIALDAAQLSGYVLKKDSPSCGLERVKVYDTHGVPSRSGRGLFAARLVARFPHLPVEEEGSLSDPQRRVHFIERVFAYARLRTLFAPRWTLASLASFHAAHTLVLMAHAPAAARELGVLVAGAKAQARAGIERLYTDRFMKALGAVATPGRHANVLRHIAGRLKRTLDRGSNAELAAAIEEYRRGFVPLSVPVALIRGHVSSHGIAYLAGQRYLDPRPELTLRT